MSTHTDTSALSKRLKSYVRRAWAQLYWEQYGPVFALSAAILALFLIGAFGGIWDRIGDPWRLIAALITLIWLGKAAYKPALENVRTVQRRGGGSRLTRALSIARWM